MCCLMTAIVRLKCRHDVDSTLAIVSALRMCRVGINFRHGVEELRMCCLAAVTARLNVRHGVASTLAIVSVLLLFRVGINFRHCIEEFRRCVAHSWK